MEYEIVSEKHEDEKLTLRKLQKHLELGTDKSINNVLNIGNQQLTESSSSSRTKRDDLLASLHSDHMPTHRRGVQSVNRGVSHQPSCCACGIAKYQLIFESLWAGFQHSDFPNSKMHTTYDYFFKKNIAVIKMKLLVSMNVFKPNDWLFIMRSKKPLADIILSNKMASYHYVSI